MVSTRLSAQNLFHSQHLELRAEQESYQLGAHPIIVGSETVQADSLALTKGVDYQLDYRTGKLHLLSIPPTDYLYIEYILVPPELRDPLFRYQVREPSDSLFSSLKRTRTPWWSEDAKLLINGSKTFAITFSDDDAFDLKQSLYVNLSGELAQNVNISAQLSDSQSKLTPEGDSKELSSLDQVFIRVFGRQYEIAMGDLSWKFDDTRYIDYSTTFEGINAWYRDRHFAQAGFSASGGKRAFSVLTIIDGKQGPYFLSATPYQTTHLIIAGSEQIYLDGRLLERGLDYYIDYSEGSVMFRTLVVSSNSVNAYYQYSDEYYKQSTYFNSSRLQILPQLNLSHHFIHQADAKNNPLLYEFSASDLDSLRLAGDSEVWGNGIVEVEPGTGSYLRRLSDTGIEYYEYADQDSSANYIIYFSFVGSGNGDYEQYSSGKYRYLGPGLGAWIPAKRLVAPVKRSNFDLGLAWSGENLMMGVEGIYTANDRNTLSSLDDADNRSGILHAHTRLQSSSDPQQSWVQLDYEQRFSDSYLFSQYYDPQAEYDFAAIASADSLEQNQLSLNLGTRVWTSWQPELMLRYKKIAGLYRQRAVRFLSRSAAYGVLPALNLRSTLAALDFSDTLRSDGLMQYHEIGSNWDRNWLKARLQLNYNSLEYEQADLMNPGNRYYKVNPSLGIGNQRVSYSDLSFSFDRSELQTDGWQQLSNSQTYALKHTTSTLNHNVSLDFTHRRVERPGEENPLTNYDLINLRNNHYLLKQSVIFNGNYVLNQTEFYPRIKELEYVGSGLGLYDSTGVYTPEGDYDYVYIVSDTGKLSSEINAQLSLYLKPGLVVPSLRRLHGDVMVQATEQTTQSDDWKRYVFYPGSVYNEDTIFGKQLLTQRLWLDLMTNRITANLGLELDRSLDNRYQSQSRTYGVLKSVGLDLKQFQGNNYSLKYEHDSDSDSRYQSDIVRQSLLLLLQRNLSTFSIFTLDLTAAREEGKSQQSSDDYKLTSLGAKPGLRGTWNRQGRAAASIGVQHNNREGSGFLSFLPEKRAGWLLNWSLSAIYRLNNFSSASLEYSGNSYPGQDARHQLKLEFKAEL